MLSVISAYYQNEEMTEQFLDNLLPLDAEVILVNAGSKPIVREGVRRIDLPENVSFSNSMNAGLKEAKGDYVCIIGNDVFPPKGWLNRLASVAIQTGAFIVSPANNQRGVDLYEPVFIREELYHTAFFPAICWLISRECLDKVGLFDERYIGGTYEDNDYALRVNIMGGKIIVDNSVVVNHLESQTMKLLGDLNEIMERNAKIHQGKWLY